MSDIDPDQEGRGDRIGVYVGGTVETMTIDLIALCKIMDISRAQLLLEIDELWDRVTEQPKKESKHVDV
jgi:hypothetical protein